MRTLAFVAVVALAACSGDAPGGGSTVDAATAACTMSLYDPCVDEHNCAAGMSCQSFNDVTPTQEVCTQVCSATTPCPNDSTGSPGTCDSTLSLCRPAKPNSCTPTL